MKADKKEQKYDTSYVQFKYIIFSIRFPIQTQRLASRFIIPFFWNLSVISSSTSGDFCLVIRSAQIKSIFKIATLLNNLTISYGDEKFRLNTYTNVGIECPVQGTFQEGRLNIKDEMIAKNDKCEFALRFTTGNDFATQIYHTPQALLQHPAPSDKPYAQNISE